MTKREAKCAIGIARTDVNMMLFYLRQLRFLLKAKYPEEEPVKSGIEIMKNDFYTWAEMFKVDRAEAYEALKLMRSGQIISRQKAKRFGKTAMPSHC